MGRETLLVEAYGEGCAARDRRVTKPPRSRPGYQGPVLVLASGASPQSAKRRSGKKEASTGKAKPAGKKKAAKKPGPPSTGRGKIQKVEGAPTKPSRTPTKTGRVGSGRRRPRKAKFSPAPTPQEAEANLRALGVVRVSLTDPTGVANLERRTKMGNHAAEGIAWAKKLGAATPRQCVLNSDYFRKTGHVRAPAVYVDEPNEHGAYLKAVVLNPAAPEWDDMAGFVREQKARNYYSTDDPCHVIYHEIGHLQLATDHPDLFRGQKWVREFLKDRKHLVGKVSERSLAGHKEFVAEVFAQLVVGKKPPDPAVMALYKKYGGREV
jgi:hypothetical protein